jgi:small subunit ribosomal protein S20|tara:strand:- start:22115 stop:22417 length:303 start_codon:yes stop_codon:yes gene_type:complete
MNKKQRNRKLVKQNRRNRMVNRRYSSTIKSLTKLFQTKIKKSTEELTTESQLELQNETKTIMNSLYSIIDKAVKKQVIHRNNAARKKSNLTKLSKTFNIK